jgi:hypothetical protein
MSTLIRKVNRAAAVTLAATTPAVVCASGGSDRTLVRIGNNTGGIVVWRILEDGAALPATVMAGEELADAQTLEIGLSGRLQLVMESSGGGSVFVHELVAQTLN